MHFKLFFQFTKIASTLSAADSKIFNIHAVYYMIIIYDISRLLLNDLEIKYTNNATDRYLLFSVNSFVNQFKKYEG